MGGHPTDFSGSGFQRLDFANTTSDGPIATSLSAVARNASSSIWLKRGPISNGTDSCDVHEKKHHLPKQVAKDGITTELIRLPRNVSCAMCSNREPLSKIADPSNWHP
jgi:hypothetical protein